VYGPFEAITQEQVARQFNTNVFGLLEVTRQMLPLFRRQNGGVLVNVTSMGGRLGFPLYSLYNSTKWAVEGFSEALLYEMRPLNIRVKVIEPGVIKTDFYERSLDVADGTPLAQEYCDLQGRCRKNIDKAPQNGAEPRRVAEVIYRAATDGSWRLRYPVGSDARQAWFLRRVLPEAAFRKVLERAVID
jgi:short-subunit dehydrogenase